MWLHPRYWLLAAALVLGGCASTGATITDDPRMRTELERLGIEDWSATPTAPADEDPWLASRLDEPLSRETAVRIALRHSPQIQKTFAELGVERAEWQEMLQVDNPSIRFSRLTISPGTDKEYGLGLSLPFLDLLRLPALRRQAGQAQRQSALQAAQSVFDLSLDVQQAWYENLSAQQVSAMRDAVARATELSARLAQRYYEAGNISELQLKQEQAAASQARIEAGHAAAEAMEKRLELHNLMGLDGRHKRWRSSGNLPLPVANEDDAASLRNLARDQNLALRTARMRRDMALAQLRAHSRWRWFGGSSIGGERERESDGSRKQGPEIELELPILHQGQARRTLLTAQWQAAEAELREAELRTDNDVRIRSNRVSTLRDIVALHRDALIPQRESIVRRSQQEHDFMLIGVFELIQAKAEEYDAYQAYLESLRDYWLARLELSRAVGQALPSAAGESEDAPSVPEILSPKAADPHAGHHGMHGSAPASSQPDTKPRAEQDPHAQHR